MTMPREDTLAILAQNVAIRGSVLPLGPTRLTEWASGLGIPKGGKVVLYTGHMYQMMPYLIGLQKRQEQWAFFSKMGSVARIFNPIMNLTAIVAMGAASVKDKRFYYHALRNIVKLLRACGIEFGYLYEQEDYAGALAYDLGLDRVFERHARRVYNRLKEYGVQTLITVDPHTTDVLKHVYPKVLGSFDIEVRSYIEILEEHWQPNIESKTDEPLVIHDSCVYARYLDMVNGPRALLSSLGFSISEPDLSGKNTHCCGGPIEALYPDKAKEIAQKRMEQLKALGGKVVTMCPICHVNLARGAGGGALHITDISYALSQALSNKKGENPVI